MATVEDVLIGGWLTVVECSICGKALDFEIGGQAFTEREDVTYTPITVRPHTCLLSGLEAICRNVSTGEVDADELAAVKSEASWVGWPAGAGLDEAIGMGDVRRCIHCGRPVVGDDSGGWLHDAYGNGVAVYRNCGLMATPEPEAAE